MEHSPGFLAIVNEVREKISEVSVDQARERLKTGKHVALVDVREDIEFYTTNEVVHPGWLLRLGNRALSMNVKLGPWIHVGSKITNFAVARYGDKLEARAAVAKQYEHKGHRFVELDVLLVANGKTAIAQIDHTAIYRPRQVAEAS